MQCPFCSKPAISQHHIIPRSEGGKDEERNIIWLCKSCHDEFEGQPINPHMIGKERLKKLGAKATSGEEYHYRSFPNGELFLGMKLPGKDELIGKAIFFPYNAQFTFVSQVVDAPNKPEEAVIKVPTRHIMGRPPIIVSPDILCLPLSLREKAALAHVSHMTIRKRIKENAPVYQIPS